MGKVISAGSPVMKRGGRKLKLCVCVCVSVTRVSWAHCFTSLCEILSVVVWSSAGLFYRSSSALYWNISSVSLWLWKFVLGLSASVLLKLSEVVLGSSAGCVLFVIHLLSQSIWNLICCAQSNSFGGATFY